MITARDQIEHIASLDAMVLVDAFDSVPSRQWDRMANAAWLKAVDDADLSGAERESLQAVYLSALARQCAAIVDDGYSVSAEQDEQSCYFCARTVIRDKAVAEGWMPNFWFNDQDAANSPVCPSCAPIHLTDLDGDPVIKTPGTE